MGNSKKSQSFKQWLTSSGGKWYNAWLIKNIFCAALALLLVIIIFSILLGVITRHNNEITVPDFTNITIAEADREADKTHLKLIIADSVYVPRLDPGFIIKQNPKGGSSVKKNRRILVTINAIKPKMVKMPSLVGYFLRQAHSELSANGLKIRKLIYVPDIASNNVIGQIYKGKAIAPGTLIPSESEIDLKVGLSSEDNTTYIPDLTNLPYSSARETIVDNSLNIGKTIFSKDIKTYTDSLEAVVYKQYPHVSDSSVTLGTYVTIYLKKK